MIDYQKYMFDDFIVKEDDGTDESDEQVDNQQPVEYILEENAQLESIEEEVSSQEVKEDAVENIEEASDEKDEKEFAEETAEISFTQQSEEEISDVVYNYVKEPEVEENIALYTEEEYNEAVSKAQDYGYNKGLEDAKNSSLEEQNLLLTDIKNQLMTIFASLGEKENDMAKDTLNFSVGIVNKILPTLEKERAEKEVKNFLAENFANFSSQEALSFSFHPDTISKVADSIKRLAEQNDFEGKISVHKDISLGPSDCRVEWKSGGVERKTSNVLGKIKNLININKQERENG